MQPPVRPATRWMRVVSMALVRIIAGRRTVSRRASLDVPAPEGPSSRMVWASRLHPLQFRHSRAESSRVRQRGSQSTPFPSGSGGSCAGERSAGVTSASMPRHLHASLGRWVLRVCTRVLACAARALPATDAVSAAFPRRAGHPSGLVTDRSRVRQAQQAGRPTPLGPSHVGSWAGEGRALGHVGSRGMGLALRHAGQRDEEPTQRRAGGADEKEPRLAEGLIPPAPDALIWILVEHYA
jgi:hypothetical protein